MGKTEGMQDYTDWDFTSNKTVPQSQWIDDVYSPLQRPEVRVK